MGPRTLKERKEKEDSWADLKIQAVSSGEGSAKSLGKLSPLPVPVRKGVVTARGKREAAAGESSEEEEKEEGSATRRRWQLARSAYRPLPATKRATTAGGEALEIHHDLYDPQQERRYDSGSLSSLSSAEEDEVDGEPDLEGDAVHLGHIEVTEQESQKVPKNTNRTRRRERRQKSGMPIDKKDGMSFEDFRKGQVKANSKANSKAEANGEDEAVLSDEPGMKFEVARDIIEGVFIDYLQREEGGDQKKKRRRRKTKLSERPTRREPSKKPERPRSHKRKLSPSPGKRRNSPPKKGPYSMNFFSA